MVFVGAVVLLVFHPIAMVAHYGLVNKGGRDGLRKGPNDDYPYCPPAEIVVTVVSLIAAACAAGWVATCAA